MNNIKCLYRIIIIYILDEDKKEQITNFVNQKTNRNNNVEEVLDFLLKEKVAQYNKELKKNKKLKKKVKSKKKVKRKQKGGVANTMLKAIDGIDGVLDAILGPANDISKVNSGDYVPRILGVKSFNNIRTTIGQAAYAARNVAAVGTGVGKVTINTIDLLRTALANNGSRIESFDMLI